MAIFKVTNSLGIFIQLIEATDKDAAAKKIWHSFNRHQKTLISEGELADKWKFIKISEEESKAYITQIEAFDRF
jgi:hypothetical protein